MSTITTKVWVWRVQADKGPDDAEATFTRFTKKETFVDGVSVGVVDLPSDTVVLAAASDLWSPPPESPQS